MAQRDSSWRRFDQVARPRRSVLRLAGLTGAGAAGAWLLACGAGAKKDSTAPAQTAFQTPAPGSAATQAAASAAPAKKGGRLQWHSATQAPNLDPTLSLSFQTHHRITLVYGMLVKLVRGKDQYQTEIAPDLAEKWESTPDGLTWTFKLRPGVKWANVAPLNGREMTAEDVVFSFRRNQSPEAPNRARYQMIDKVEAVDKTTVKFTLGFPHPQFLFNMGAEPSEIVPREAVEQKGDLKNWGAGTGPFVMTRYEPAEIATYDRNPNYYDADKVYLDGIDYLVVPDKNTAIANFRAEKLDLLGFNNGMQALTKSDKDAILRTNPKARVEEYLNPGLTAMEIRFAAEPFTDPRVRRAINHALNRDAFIAALAEGEAAYTGTYPYHRFPDYALPQEELKGYAKFDLKTAKDLLTAAGYPNGFRAKIMWEPGRKAMVDITIEMMKAIGVQLDTAAEAVDYPAWVSKTYNGQFSQFAAWGYLVGGIWDYIHGLHHSAGNRNGPQTKVPEIDAKIDAALRTTDTAKHVQAVKEVERWALTEGLYILPLYSQKSYLISQPWVQGFLPGFGAMGGVYSSHMLSAVNLAK